MDTKNVCRLCLVYKNEIIGFFSDEGMNLNITKILVQHFWFQIHHNDNLPVGICRICWKYVNDFHDFYKNIEIIHENYYDNLQFKDDLKISTNIKSEITEFNNDTSSLNHSNIEFVEPIVEIKLENEKIASNVKTKRKVGIKSTSNKMLKSLTKSQKTKTIKNDNSTKSKTRINLRKVLNAKLLNGCKKYKQIRKSVQQPAGEIPITVNDVINDDIIEVKDEFNTSNDNILHINDVTENPTDDKIQNLDKNPKKTAENIQIREFFNLKCEICSSQHAAMNELRKHYQEAHNSKSGYVLCCKKKLYKRGELLEHMLWHTNPDAFRCTVCNQIYANKRALKIHMHFHSTPEERKYICDICGDNFTLRYHLMKHFRRMHLPEKNIEFNCNQCNKSFTKKSKLQDHIRAVHELKYVNICQICAKVYKSKSQCQIHYLEEHVYINKPKLKCNLCDSMLKNESSLKRHMQRKHYEGPIACNLCGKIVSSKNSLQNHKRYVHTEPKHKCNLCDKAFNRPIRLKEHIATHYGTSHLYTCPYCTTSFNSQANMRIHQEKKHPVEWLEDRQRRLGITTAAHNFRNPVM